MRVGYRALQGLSGHDAGRQLLAEMYREMTGNALPEIGVTPQGKPYFLDAQMHFSISHTDSQVFCVLSEEPVGIDAEAVDRKIDLRLAEKILSVPEKQRYDQAADKRQALLKLFVQKEAYAKLTGRGWGNYLYETDFDPDNGAVREMHGCFVAIIDNGQLTVDS